MEILVTGGTGFFGKSQLRCWKSGSGKDIHNARITLLSRNPEAFRSSYGELIDSLNISLVRGDILQADSLPEGNFSHILHAATDSTTGLMLSPLQRYDQIVIGTRNILDLAVRCGKPRVLLTSSGGVYGDISQFKDGVSEDYTGMPDPLDSRNAYSVAKRQAEHLCALYHDMHGLDYVIARCFAFVGIDLPLSAHFAVGNIIRDALWNDEIIINGDGTAIRSYMDQRNLSQWLNKMLLHGKPGQAYNVGSDQSLTIAELAKLVRDLVSPQKSIRLLNKSENNSGRSRYISNISKARIDLGLELSFTLEDSILEVANFHS